MTEIRGVGLSSTAAAVRGDKRLVVLLGQRRSDEERQVSERGAIKSRQAGNADVSGGEKRQQYGE